MKTEFIMHKKLIWVILAGILVFLAGVAQARVSALTVAVDGMACPFCAFGVEKKLKTVKGMESVAVDMKTGTASLTAGPAESIHFQEVPKAIKEAGFTAGVMKITISGTINKESDGSFVLIFDGPSLPLIVENNDLTAPLNNYAESGKSAVLNGTLIKKGNKAWSLTPESITAAIP